MNEVEIKSLSLAAYIMTSGVKLIKINDNRTYILNTDRSEDEWMLEYVSSKCSEFDRNIMNLKWFMKKK